MTVGLIVTKPTLDDKVGALAVRLRDDFIMVDRIATWLGRQVDADLVAMGYTQAEVTRLKDAFTALDTLRRISRGQTTATDPVNYFQGSDRLTGLE